MNEDGSAGEGAPTSETMNVRRRTVMGTLAALSAGKVTGVSAASSGSSQSSGQASEDDGDPGTAADHLPDYANPAGRINHQGLQQAIDDWNNGVITRAEFEAVKEGFRTGERVVDKVVETITSNINEDTLIEKNPDDPGGEAIVWQFDGRINVNAELEIEPGVVMEFTQGSGLELDNGPLLMDGTASQEIFVTGTAARQGWWNGFYVDNGDLQNSMSHVIIEYGGRNNSGNVQIPGGTAMAITNCTLRWSGSYGLYQASGGNLLEEGDNVYAANREAGIRTTTSNTHQLSASSEYDNNDRNYVFVVGNTAADEGADEETRNWEDLEVPYQLHGTHRVNNLTLTMDPGTQLEFTQGSYMEFENGSRVAVEGTVDDPIVFSGTDKQRGWWRGIYLDDATDTENRFRHCVFEYGGNDWDGILDVASGGTDDGAVELQNCTFRNASGFGLVAGGGSELRNCENNTYTGNSAGAAWIGTENIESLSSSSDFTGNDNDYVLVRDRGVSGAGRDEDQRTWDSINVPYRMNGYHTIDNLELVVDPGATFEFTENAAMEFQSGARIRIRGIDDETEEIDPITFTATDKQRGWWRGIYLDDSTDQENIMEHVIVEYAGADGWLGGVDVASGGTDNGYLQFSNCTFQNCAQFGVNVGGGGGVENLSSNLYTSNGEGAMRIGTENMEALASSSDFTGNDNDYVLVKDRNINGEGAGSDSRTWDAINVPYRMDGYHNINNVELNVDPGANFEFTENAALEFESGSAFIIQGEEGSEITFSGTEDERGWWRGIYLDDTESRKNRLEYVTIENGGNGWNGQLDIASGGTDNGQIEVISNCTFRDGDGYGIDWGGNSRVREMSNNRYTNHTDGAVLSRTSNIHELDGNSDFTGNDTDRVVVRNTNLSSGDVPSGQDGVTWDNINVPYEMRTGTHNINVPLTVEAGSRLEFQEESLLEFSGTDAQIQIMGESGNEITLTGTEDARDLGIKGWWEGIYLDDATSKTNRLEYAVVEWAGRADVMAGAVDIASGGTDDGYLEVRNSTIRKSESSGLYAANTASVNDDVCEVNTFEDNDGEDCFIDN